MEALKNDCEVAKNVCVMSHSLIASSDRRARGKECRSFIRCWQLAATAETDASAGRTAIAALPAPRMPATVATSAPREIVAERERSTNAKFVLETVRHGLGSVSPSSLPAPHPASRVLPLRVRTRFRLRSAALPRRAFTRR